MIFSFSSVVNMTFACCILTSALTLLIRHNKVIARFGTPLILGIIVALMLRFLIPIEFPFTKTIFIYEIYPAVYLFLIDDMLSLGNLHFSICDILLMIWIIGSIFLFVRSIVQYMTLRKTYYACKCIDNSNIINIVDKISTEFNKSKSFTIVEFSNIGSPLIFGIMHPYIVLPNISFTDEEWYFILKHELTHYYHKHLVLKLICEVMCNIYWWNPASYIIRHFLKLIMEMDADANAVDTLSKADTYQYINCLTKIAQRQAHQKSPFEWSVTFISTPKTYLGKRSNYLLENINRPPKLVFPAFLTGAIFVVLFLCSIFFIFEPSNYKNVSFPGTWSFMDEGCFLIENDNNTYSLYINWRYNTDRFTVPTDDPYVKIYNNLMEAYKYEVKK